MDVQKNITLTYLNVRQSISILIFKLVLIDILAGIILIGAYYAMANSILFLTTFSIDPNIFLTIFITLGLLKVFLNAYIVLVWLNEYYEITPDYVAHRKGILFRKQEKYHLKNLRKIVVQDSFLGELLNFGTISLYDVRLNKYLDMYLIHNPDRYARAFKTILPEIEMKEDRTWVPFLKKGNDSLSDLEQDNVTQ